MAVIGVCCLVLAVYFYLVPVIDFLADTPIVIDPRPLEYDKIQHIVCLVYTGRLGNNMFQFASSYGIARSKGMRLVVPDAFELLKVFKLNVDVIKENDHVCRPDNVITRSERKACSFDQRLINFPSTADIRIALYLQSYRYFDKYCDELRKQFIFKENIINKAKFIFKQALQKLNITSRNNTTFIGVHVRRGDFVNNPAGYTVATKEYLQKAVNWYQFKYGKLLYYIVATDGIEWTKENMPNNLSVFYLEGNAPAVDMATLSLCDHFISTEGSFSWWSAWLTGGNVTYYKWPAKKGSPLRSAYSKNYSDFYYPHWKGL